MDKIDFDTLNLKNSVNDCTVKINDVFVNVRQYLPIEEKQQFLAELLNYVFDDTGVPSTIRQQIIFSNLIIRYYTNIDVENIQLEKLYNFLQLNTKIYNTIIDAIPPSELETLRYLAEYSIKNITNYEISLRGTLNSISNDQVQDTEQLKTMLEQIQNNDNFATVKKILDKLN